MRSVATGYDRRFARAVSRRLDPCAAASDVRRRRRESGAVRRRDRVAGPGRLVAGTRGPSGHARPTAGGDRRRRADVDDGRAAGGTETTR